MLHLYKNHNLFRESVTEFKEHDPHLHGLAQFKYQFDFVWWSKLNLDIPGIYILTGGRQIGKSTSCKQLIAKCLDEHIFSASNLLYLPCDEIYDAVSLGKTLRLFLESVGKQRFLLIIDEITFVPHWDRVIKALADEGAFRSGVCLLTGSDTLILQEAAMSFPGRRGKAAQTDFHLYPLSFKEYVELTSPDICNLSLNKLQTKFADYLNCGGYLRAINDLAQEGGISVATFRTYEQWIRGDFLKQGKNESTLLAILHALLTIGASQISYSSLTQKIGLVSKETCMDYCRLLERMDILFNLQAFDQNKKQGFPRKARKFHLSDPFICRTILNWLQQERYLGSLKIENVLVESCLASHCKRIAPTFYFKGKGEVDVVWLRKNMVEAIEVKWAKQIRSSDIKTLKLFQNKIILTKTPMEGVIDNVQAVPVYKFLFDLT